MPRENLFKIFFEISHLGGLLKCLQATRKLSFMNALNMCSDDRDQIVMKSTRNPFDKMKIIKNNEMVFN